MLTQTWGSVFIYRHADIYLCISTTISMILLNPYYIPQGNGTLHNILYFKLTKHIHIYGMSFIIDYDIKIKKYFNCYVEINVKMETNDKFFLSLL